MNDSMRGTKRKRSDRNPEDVGLRIRQKLHHEVKEIRKVIKKAKVFESQKLVKRLKAMRKEGDNQNSITEHEEQLLAIKTINPEDIGNIALKSKVLKDRTLSSNSFIMAAISGELGPNRALITEPSPILLKVQNRLLSSKILSKEIARVLESLYKILTPSSQEEILDRDNVQENQITLDRKRFSPPPRAQKKDSAEQDESDTDEVSSESSSALVDRTGWESGTVDISEDEFNAENDSTGITSGDAKPLRVGANKSMGGAPLTETRSMFLPSLSVGYVRGESDDSERSDGEQDIREVQVKKNRRGQRARQAIWEKKYGRNANHKKKREFLVSKDGQKLNVTTPQTSTLRTPWKKSSHTPHSLQHHNPTHILSKHTPGPERSHSNSSDRPLHPSWEAKKKIKEKESAAMVPSQGKKIKFT